MDFGNVINFNEMKKKLLEKLGKKPKQPQGRVFEENIRENFTIDTDDKK